MRGNDDLCDASETESPLKEASIVYTQKVLKCISTVLTLVLQNELKKLYSAINLASVSL